MSDLSVSKVRLRAGDVPRTGTSCRVLRGRRKSDTDWLVIHIGDDGRTKADHFKTEGEARRMAARLESGSGEIGLGLPASRVGESEELLLRKPSWWI